MRFLSAFTRSPDVRQAVRDAAALVAIALFVAATCYASAIAGALVAAWRMGSLS
jgi:hypothetical protein